MDPTIPTNGNHIGFLAACFGVVKNEFSLFTAQGLWPVAKEMIKWVAIGALGAAVATWDVARRNAETNTVQEKRIEHNEKQLHELRAELDRKMAALAAVQELRRTEIRDETQEFRKVTREELREIRDGIKDINTQIRRVHERITAFHTPITWPHTPAPTQRSPGGAK